MMIGIRRVYKSVAVIGRSHESVPVIRSRGLNSEAEAKYHVGSGSSGEGQNQTVAATDHKAEEEPKTRKKWYGYRPPGTRLGSISILRNAARARKEGSNLVLARDPNAVEIDNRVAGHMLKEIQDAMPELTPEQKLRTGPCEVCGKEKDHFTRKCPFLESIPKGEEGNVLEKYGIVCRRCGMEDGHPERRDWTGRAQIKYCVLCFVVGDHRYTDCPNLEPEERERIRQLKKRSLPKCN